MSKYKQLFIGVFIGATLFSGITALAKDQTIKVAFNNIMVKINGQKVTMDTEPMIFSGRTYVPIRAIGEAFNKDVSFDSSSNTVNINDKPEPTPILSAVTVSIKDGMYICTFNGVEYVSSEEISKRFPDKKLSFIDDIPTDYLGFVVNQHSVTLTIKMFNPALDPEFRDPTFTKYGYLYFKYQDYLNILLPEINKG